MFNDIMIQWMDHEWIMNGSWIIFPLDQVAQKGLDLENPSSGVWHDGKKMVFKPWVIYTCPTCLGAC